MERHSRSSKPERFTEDADMEMTPMIDVTFLLLIFFMCTLKFKNLEGKLAAYLPKDLGLSCFETESLEPLEVSIHVRTPGTRLNVDGNTWGGDFGQRYIFDRDRVVDYSMGPRHGLDLSSLRSQLGQLDLSAYSSGVALNPGVGVVQAEAIGVVDLFMDLGIHEVRIRGAQR
jgi:hypothetical protein